MLYYTTPPGDILTDTDTAQPTEAKEQAQAIIKAFAAVGVGVALVKSTTAPQLNAYHFKLTKIKDFPKVKRNLPTVAAACRCEIMQTVSAVGDFCLTVPRQRRQVISLCRVVNSPEFVRDKSALPVAVGVASDNKIIVLDIAQMPHILLAGTTGSGKDPKRVEFGLYAGLPHLLHPIGTEPAAALHILKELCRLMDNRYKELEQEGKKNIAQTDKPHIILAVDELADLLLTDDGEAESYLIRLAQLGRAAGVHLILATQRPTRAVIPGLLSANMPCKIALKVSSIRESVIILDHKGAEALTGCGDALIKTPDKTKEIRTQTAFTRAEDVESLVKWWTTQGISEE